MKGCTEVYRGLEGFTGGPLSSLQLQHSGELLVRLPLRRKDSALEGQLRLCMVEMCTAAGGGCVNLSQGPLKP